MHIKNIRYLVTGNRNGDTKVVSERAINVEVSLEIGKWCLTSESSMLYDIGDIGRADRASAESIGETILVFDCTNTDHLNQMLYVAQKYRDRILGELAAQDEDRETY